MPRETHLVVTTQVTHKLSARVAIRDVLALLAQRGVPLPMENNPAFEFWLEPGFVVISWERTPEERQAAVTYPVPLSPLPTKGVGEPEPPDLSPPVMGDIKPIAEDPDAEDEVGEKRAGAPAGEEPRCTHIRAEDVEQAEREVLAMKEKQEREAAEEARQEEIHARQTLGMGDERS